MTKGSDLLVAALENEGVERVFGIPGEENLDVVESLRGSRIELVVTRHEQAAGFMAATHGRLTGKPGVCIATLGPGALNLTTAAAYAHVGAMPMVMITGQKGIRTSRQARFQMVDIVAAMRPLTKLARQIVSAATIPTLVREAFRVAEEERPGSVLLELPEDVAADTCEGVHVVPPHPLELPVAGAEVLDRAAATLVDLLGLINGDVDPKKYISGQNVSDWVSANRPGSASTQTGMSSEEVQSRLEAFDPQVLTGYDLGSSVKTSVATSPALARKNIILKV